MRNKADETRRAAIETRFRTMYPDLGITVSYHDARRVTVDHDDVHLGLTRPGFTVSFRSGDLGFEEHLDRNVTVEGAVKLLRFFADDLALDHQQHLEIAASAVAAVKIADSMIAAVDTRHPALRLGYPAATGDVVTQAHTNYCAEHGHATHATDGEPSLWCPRCGAARAEAITPDERGARLEETRVRIRKVVADAEQYGNTSQVVTIDDLRALLEAADIMLDGVTAAEIAEHEDRIERDVATHEESLTDEEYRA